MRLAELRRAGVLRDDELDALLHDLPPIEHHLPMSRPFVRISLLIMITGIFLVVLLRHEPVIPSRAADVEEMVESSDDIGGPAIDPEHEPRVREDDSIPAGPRPADPGGVYESEDFAQVPEWIPLHSDAVAAEAENVSLRSDGFREGVIGMSFAEGFDPFPELRSHLETAGFREEGDRFLSEDPERSVHVSREDVGTGSRVWLEYSGFDHSGDCGCPTCAGETGVE